MLKYNIRAVRALGSARSDLTGLDKVVESGAGDILAQQRPDVLLLAVEPGCSQGPLGRPSSFPLALAAASPSLVRSEIRFRLDLGKQSEQRDHDPVNQWRRGGRRRFLRRRSRPLTARTDLEPSTHEGKGETATGAGCTKERFCNASAIVVFLRV